jgi:SAM-dependent methyltransferase
MVQLVALFLISSGPSLALFYCPEGFIGISGRTCERTDMHITVCPYCGSKSARKWYADGGDPVNRCFECDLIYRERSDNEKSWNEYYRKQYFQDFAEEQGGVLRASIYEEALEIIGRNTVPGSLFDIGAGSGTFLAMAKEKGWSVTGQEISAGCCRVAREKYGLELIQKELNTLCLPSNAFDAVTMINVFDHLVEPWLLLGDIHRSLKTGGILYIRVPNGSLHGIGYRFSSIVPRGYLRDKVQKFFVLHRYHVTPRFIRTLFGHYAFKPVVIRPSTVSKDVPYRHFKRDERFILMVLKKALPPFARTLCRASGGAVVLSPSLSIYGIKG